MAGRRFTHWNRSALSFIMSILRHVTRAKHSRFSIGCRHNVYDHNQNTTTSVLQYYHQRARIPFYIKHQSHLITNNTMKRKSNNQIQAIPTEAVQHSSRKLPKGAKFILEDGSMCTSYEFQLYNFAMGILFLMFGLNVIRFVIIFSTFLYQS